MSAPQLPRDASQRLALRTREQFVAHVEAMLKPMAEAVADRMGELVGSSPNAADVQSRREAHFDYQRLHPAWIQASAKAWRQAVNPPPATAPSRPKALSLELIDDDVVEQNILSSRLAMAIQEKASWELNDLKVRMQYLEGGEDMAASDVLRPETLPQLLVDQWIATSLSREAWAMAQDAMQPLLVEKLTAAYREANQYLISQGVMRDIDLSSRVRRGAGGPAARKGEGSAAEAAFAPTARADIAPPGVQGGAGGGVPPPARAGAARPPGGAAPVGRHAPASGAGPSGAAGAGYAQRSHSSGGGVADETRLMTNTTPLARVAARATGVLGQLRRLLTDHVAGFDPQQQTRPSPALAEAMSQQATQLATHVQTQGAQDIVVFDDAAVEEVARDLRHRTGELKKKASTSTEKATIEIVALMFQSILSEERIPPSIRVWFARLQMPVLRVAIAEPEFFDSLQHPARQLIDRMGSCVMGFEATAVGGGALEVEIKRVVQVIEQYPETGRRVFQLVYDEFQKFLARFLTEKGTTQRLVSVAQQVEQKETLAIQYTIELRSILTDVPVREEIREFLFKVWTEVLALAAIKKGPQHDETLALKKAAADLVWSASAKPNRQDRARVIQDLPKLLLRLRQGMGLIGIEGAAQEVKIKALGDILADAFMSKTEAIPQARIEAMTERLAHLEEFVTDGSSADLPLDKDSIEMILGIDASTIEVVSDGGSRPSAAMLAWAMELQPGTWFTLDHNGKAQQVQYAWRSDRKQLHLFASPAGHSFLVQARRLAAYLQAGLLVPAEEEALTVRATRAALAKLDANPERLLQ